MAYRWRASLVVALALFMAVLDNTIVNVALPQMQSSFRTAIVPLVVDGRRCFAASPAKSTALGTGPGVAVTLNAAAEALPLASVLATDGEWVTPNVKSRGSPAIGLVPSVRCSDIVNGSEYWTDVGPV
jgi:hypothetical protein